MRLALGVLLLPSLSQRRLAALWLVFPIGGSHPVQSLRKTTCGFKISSQPRHLTVKQSTGHSQQSKHGIGGNLRVKLSE